MYIAPGQGQTAPREQKFDVNTKALSLYPFVASFKEISLKSDFIQFFHDFIRVYSPKAGADNPLGTKFLCQQEHFVTLVICCKFQKNLSDVWFYTIFFHDFIHVYSLGARADSPQGTKFWCQQKYLVISFICCNLSEVWFCTFYWWFNTCILPRGRGRQPPGDKKFDVNTKALSIYPFVASFKEISLKSDFIYFFSWFNTCIYPQGRVHTDPRGQSFDVNRNFLSLRSSVASFKS